MTPPPEALAILDRLRSTYRLVTKAGAITVHVAEIIDIASGTEYVKATGNTEAMAVLNAARAADRAVAEGRWTPPKTIEEQLEASRLDARALSAELAASKARVTELEAH